jgi:FLVCR family feline leukemia virus subgroup C receptor-related protein
MHERTLSTCLGSFLNLVGLNFSIFYASITFEELANQLDEIIKEIDYMNLLYSIMNTIAFIMCLLMIRNEPPTPPSLSAVLL